MNDNNSQPAPVTVDSSAEQVRDIPIPMRYRNVRTAEVRDLIDLEDAGEVAVFIFDDGSKITRERLLADWTRI